MSFQSEFVDCITEAIADTGYIADVNGNKALYIETAFSLIAQMGIGPWVEEGDLVIFGLKSYFTNPLTGVPDIDSLPKFQDPVVWNKVNYFIKGLNRDDNNPVLILSLIQEDR